MDNCNIIQDLIILYYDGISQDGKKLVDEHVASCEECRALLQSANVNTAQLQKEYVQNNKKAAKSFTKLFARITVIISAALVFCVLAIYLLTLFLYNSSILYPVGYDDADYNRTVGQAITIQHTNTGDYQCAQYINTRKECNQKNIKYTDKANIAKGSPVFMIDIPVGYMPNGDIKNSFINKNTGVTVDVYPRNAFDGKEILNKTEYNTFPHNFADDSLKTETEIVLFSYGFNVNSVTVLNSQKDIMLASDVKKVKAMLGKTNSKNDVIYPVQGDYFGYVYSVTNSEGQVIKWNAVIESEGRVAEITISKTDESPVDIDTIVGYIATVEFV